MDSQQSSRQRSSQLQSPIQTQNGYYSRRSFSSALRFPGHTSFSQPCQPEYGAYDLGRQDDYDQSGSWDGNGHTQDIVLPGVAPDMVTSDFNINEIQQMVRPAHDLPYTVGVPRDEISTPWPTNIVSSVPKAYTVAGPGQSPAFKRPFPPQQRQSLISVADSGYGSLQSSSNSSQEIKTIKVHDAGAQYGRNNAPKAPQSVKTEGGSTGRKRRRSRSDAAKCEVCDRELKNPSDATKHMLTHTKPHLCLLQGCNRIEGFATINDLERHKKSVHGMDPSVGKISVWICAACPPSTPGSGPKIWPRQDNFKAHIGRKHAGWDMQSLIKASEQKHRPDIPVSNHGYSSQPALSNPPDDMNYQDCAGSVDFGMPNQASASQCDNHFYSFTSYPMDSLALAHVGGVADSHLGHMQDVQAQFSTPQYSSQSSMVMRPASTPQYQMSSEMPMNFPQSTSRDSVPDICLNGQPFAESGSVNAEDCSNKRLKAGSVSSATSHMSTTSGHSEEKYQCSVCDKIKRRECDLRKHMKRHTRPYGCTFAKCSRRFGSRNDWKRHENSQHFLAEMWRCEKERRDGAQCGKLAHNINQFRQHLYHDHDLKPTSAENKAACHSMHLGREGHHHFWCGFCRRLIEQNKGIQPGAWDVRFKHIGDHFDKQGLKIDDWVDIETNKKKRYLDGGEGGKKGFVKEGVDDDSDLGEDGIPDIQGVCDVGGKSLGRGFVVGEDVDADGVSDDEMRV